MQKTSNKPIDNILSTKTTNYSLESLDILNKHLIFLRSLKEAFS